MKSVLAIIVVVALIADVAIFLGVGFGVGALTVAPSSCSTGEPCTVWSPGLENSAGLGAGFSVGVNTSPAQSGNAPITAMLAGYQSTPIQFSLVVFNTGDCGDSGRPVWAPGTGADYGYFTIQYLVGGAAQPFSGQLDGAPVTTGTGTVLTPSESNLLDANGTGFITYCEVNAYGQDVHPAGYPVIPAAMQHTLSLTGLYANGVLVVSFNLFYTYCAGNDYIGQSSAVCVRGYNAAQNQGSQVPSGGNTLSASESINVWSAGSSITVLNANSIYNGGSIRVGVTTGYDGTNGYQLEVLCPPPRACGGQADPAFSTQTVPNEVLNQRIISIPVPSTYSVNNSNPKWNEVTVALIANYGVASQTLPFSVDISPLYKPGVPVITYKVSGSNIYPAIGDTVSLTVYANSSAHSAPVNDIELALFYVQQGASGSSPPGCGSYWITGCPSSSISVQLLGNNSTVGHYEFTVQPPVGATAIAGEALSESSTAQGSNSSLFYLPIKAAGCVPGTTCDPTQSGLTNWEWIGPITFIIAIVLAVLLLMLFVPVPVWVRIMVPAVLAVVLGLLFTYIQVALFAAGTVFGGPAG